APFVVETQNNFADAQLSFFIEDIVPQSIDLSLDIPRSSLISVRQEFAGFNLAYYGGLAGEVSLSGYFDDLSIDGDLFLDRGTLSQPVQAPAPTENEAITQIDLSITAGKNLTGVFPTVDLPILVARIRDEETIDITANLAQERFSVSGEVDIRGGEIIYFQRNFFIVDGRLNLQLDQNNVDPRISLTAKLKDFDRDGNKVDIFLSLNNDRIDNLSPSFYAQPDKTLAEISEILGRNIIPTDILGSSNLSAALAFATLATDVIQQVGLIQLDPIQELELSIRNSLNLDLFSIRTMVFQNILLDTIPGEFSSSYSSNPIARYLDNTTLLLGKYVTDDMFLQAIIQLSVSDDAGVGLFFTNELGLDIELSYEWNNPLYNLSIATQPEAFSFKQLLDSISIGVAWSYSF
ncbi:MAG: translocation/assembly module TamB domain-containing protein, partial [Spirochaetota bacterium]